MENQYWAAWDGNYYNRWGKSHWAAWDGMKEKFRVIMELTHEEVDALLDDADGEPPTRDIVNQVTEVIMEDWDKKNKQPGEKSFKEISEEMELKFKEHNPELL